MPIQGRKYVIVGGAGVVGCAVAHTLIAQYTADVIICDRFGNISDRKWANLPSKMDDLWAPASLLENLEKAWREIAGVILLTDDGTRRDDCDAVFEAAYHLPRRIWDFCVAKQRPLLWTSPSYGHGATLDHTPADPSEVMEVTPITAFGRAQKAFDVFAAKRGSGPAAPPRWAGFKLSSVYGQHETSKGDHASLPARAMAAARAGATLSLWENSLSVTRDWVHVADAAAAISAVAVGDKTGFFDIGTGRVYTTADVITCVETLTGKTLKTATIMAPEFGAGSLRAADLSALEAAGIAVPFRTLEQGLLDL